MKFSDALAAQTLSKGPDCSFVSIKASLDKDDLAALTAALDGSTPSTLIERALRDIGVNITSTTIRRHRRGDCGCGRG